MIPAPHRCRKNSVAAAPLWATASRSRSLATGRRRPCRWEERGLHQSQGSRLKQQFSMGKPWENHGKTMGKPLGKSWETHNNWTTIGKSIGKPEENSDTSKKHWGFWILQLLVANLTLSRIKNRPNTIISLE